MESKEPITVQEFWRQRYRPYLTELTGEEFIQFDEEDLREYAEHKKKESIKKIEQLIKSCDKNCPKETIRAYSVVLKILNHE